MPAGLPARSLRPRPRAVAGVRRQRLAHPASDPPGGKRLLERLENLQSLGDATGFNEVRSLRGIRIEIDKLPGLCRKTRQALPAAIRHGLEKNRRSPTSCLTPMSCFGVFEGRKTVAASEVGQTWIGTTAS